MKIKMPENVKTLLNKLHNNGYQAYIYGACIRDYLLGKEPISWDITTNALPNDIVIIFDENEGFSTIPSIQDYGIVMVLFKGESYQVNTFRTGEERRFADDINEDLLYKDFTMDSIAYNEQEGLLDPYNGVGDIKNRLIRCARNPFEQMQEDSVRILRAIRFETQLGFNIEPKLLQAIKDLKDSIPTSGSERVRNEFIQILLSEQPSQGIRRLLELGLLERLIPELIPTIGFDTRSSYHDKDVFEHTLVVLDNTEPNLTLRLAALLHDIDKPNCLTIDEDGEGHCYGHASSSSEIARTILGRLNFDRKTVKAVTALIKEHMNDFVNISDLSIKRLIRRVGLDNIDRLFELQLADIKGSELSGRDPDRTMKIRNKCFEVLSRREPLTVHDLDISGYDLLSLGYPPGKEIGEVMDYLLDQVVDNPALNQRDTLITLLKNRK
ncbi:MAG TPA: polynucleotide adenylyltransferase [Syntrophomonas sp.]|nr:polynucleotide adenylyltransferase [Syntrophomonas sp.]